MIKKLTLSILTILSTLFIASPVQAESSLSFTFPVKVPTTKQLEYLGLPQRINQLATPSATPITWLLNYDTLTSATASAYFTDLNLSPEQELGVLLEITPVFLENVGLPRAINPSTAHLINSYHPEVRYQIIDQYFSLFKQLFGHYPRVVGAPYLDALSLSYLADHYGVKAALLNLPSSGNLTLDHYFPYPYFPSKHNTLVPSPDRDQAINIMVSFWQGLPSNSDFVSLLSNPRHQSSLISFGLEESLTVDQQLEVLPDLFTSLSSLDSLTTVGDFADHFITYNPLTTPTYLSSGNQFTTYASPHYFLTLDRQKSQLTSLVFYNHHETEAFLFDRNPNAFLNLNTYPLVTPDQPISLSTPLLDYTLTQDSSFSYTLSFTDYLINLKPKSFTTNLNLNLPSHPQVNLITSGANQTFSATSWRPYYTPLFTSILNITKLIALFLFLAYLFKYPPKRLFKLISRHFTTFIILLFGTFIWSLTISRSGSLTPYGLSFWGPHSHDALFHLSLIESFKQSLYPLINPNLIDTTIHNYHLLYDYLLALLSLLLNIPSLDLYFRLIPPLLAFFIGLTSFTLLRRWRYSPSQARLSLVFVYLTGSLGFIPHFFQKGTLWGGESIFWMQQNISTLINPPFALSLLILLIFLNLYHSWHDSLSPKHLLILSLIGALLIQAKAYASVLLIFALFAHLSLSVITTRRISFSKLLLPAFLLVFSVLLFLPTYASSGSLFQFAPLWFIRSLVSAQDRLNLESFASAWQVYQATDQYPKLLLVHMTLTLVYLLGNLGIRVLALPAWWQSFFKSASQPLVAWIILAGLAVPFVFIQSGNSWNSIQFSYYSLFFLSLLLGPPVASLLSRSHTLPKFLILLFLVTFLTLPTTIGTLKEYASLKPSTSITHQELRVLDYLSRQPHSRVITPVHSRTRRHPYSAPIPIHPSDSPAYVPALTSHQALFADEVNLEIMDYSYQKIRQNNLRFYNTTDYVFPTDFVRQNQIEYIYQTSQDHMNTKDLSTHFDTIFTSGNYSLLTPKIK